MASRKVLDTVLHSKSSVKVIVLLVLVILIPAARYLNFAHSSTYFGNKRNFLNDYVAKLSWGWLLFCVVPITFVCSFLYSGLQLRMILRHLFRLVIGHGMFMLVTALVIPLSANVFPLAFGHCVDNHIIGLNDCISSGSQWVKIDISGHSFLLAYCIFVMSEECQMIEPHIWNSYVSLFGQVRISTGGAISSDTPALCRVRNKQVQLLTLHSYSCFVVKLFEVIACVEVFLMGTIFIATQLYHHTFIENCLGYLLAVLSWYVTYQLLYGKYTYGPSAVHEGRFNPLKNVI